MYYFECHFRSGEFYGKLKILTGPNASGKSVYLKMVKFLNF